MTGKRPENSTEIRYYIKARSLLGLKPVDIYRKMGDIYGEDKCPKGSVCRRVAVFKAGQQDLKDAARLGRRPTTTTKSNIKKITDLLYQMLDTPKGI